MKTLFAMAAAITTLALLSEGMSAEEKGKPRRRALTGQVAKVEANTLTLLMRGDSGERTEKFAIGPFTKVTVQTAENKKVKGEGGRERLVPQTRAGKLADLKAKQRVTVTYTEAGKADGVLILRLPPPRKGERER